MSDIITKSYADALFQVGKSENCLEKIYEDYLIVEQVINKDFLRLFSNPKMNKNDKLELIQTVFKDMNIYLIHFFKILVKKNRFLKVLEIKQQFNEFYYEENGILEASVYSAVELNEDQIINIKKTFEKKYNKEILIHFIKDESLIAGLKVKIKDDVYDNTLVNQLRRLKEKI